MSFNRSLLNLIETAPYKTDAQGNVTQTLTGVFILLDQRIFDELELDELTDAQKTELRTWIHKLTAEQAGEWHVPMWAGAAGAFYVRIPAAIWADPKTAPPVKVRRYFRRYFSAD